MTVSYIVLYCRWLGLLWTCIVYFDVQIDMVRYISPVNPAVYPHLAVTLLTIGLFFMAWFFVYPVNSVALHTHIVVCVAFFP